MFRRWTLKWKHKKCILTNLWKPLNFSNTSRIKSWINRPVIKHMLQKSPELKFQFCCNLGQLLLLLLPPPQTKFEQVFLLRKKPKLFRKKTKLLLANRFFDLWSLSLLLLFQVELQLPIRDNYFLLISLSILGWKSCSPNWTPSLQCSSLSQENT